MKFISFIKKYEEALTAIAILITAIVVMFMCSLPCNAQYVRQGNKIMMVSAPKDTIITNLVLVDNQGIERTIILNKSNGRCWIWKESKKTGKMYKQYIKNELAEEIAKEYGVEFKSIVKK